MKSKLIVIIVIGLIIVVFLSYFFIKSKKTQNILGTNNKIDYSLDEINLHSSKDDCWTIIDNQVYHFGASLKDLGKKWFAFSKFDKEAVKVLEKLS